MMVSEQSISKHQGETPGIVSFPPGDIYRTCHNSDDEDFFGRFVRLSAASVYPVIAMQVVVRTGIRSGLCIDLGSGPAPLAVALARVSDLHILALDSSEKALSQVPGITRALSLEDRIHPLLADAHKIPLGDEICDLVASRGSYHLWKNLPLVLKEIYRVLKPGGKAYIGGGYGCLTLRDRVNAWRKNNSVPDDLGLSDNFGFCKYTEEEIRRCNDCVDIRSYRIINNESGFWVLIDKEV